ncbi:MAG: hypothetical protein JXD22_03865 [Sedimentisphaerales bacterium]|nr:hypothetical protein [Sedimentisphaerales bacterium]
MAQDYSVETCGKLAEKFKAAGLYRPLRVERYDAGTVLEYEVTGVWPAVGGRVRLEVDKFVGGGFAGQVYRVKVLEVNYEQEQGEGKKRGEISGLEVGKLLAMKIMVPPSRFSQIFRNAVYALGFQGPFQLQVNPAAARAGALWQKFIRRAAAVRMGSERAVVDIIATLVDERIGSCGELSEWVEGRTWRLETDDRLDLLKQWRRGKAVDQDLLGSPEYRAKKQFMGDFVKLLHEMGAPEFARQYEWSTCKSQPNCLKLRGTDDDPAGGLVAVDFRAGLALLPYLPMSPGDFKLIAKGIGRGSLVQFDRGSLSKLEQFMQANREQFRDMEPALEELKQVERIYRDSVPDVTHNHLRLLGSGRLWRTMFDSAVTGWRVRNLVDEAGEEKFRNCKMGTALFALVGLIPLLGRLVRRLWGRADYRRHYGAMLSGFGYLRRAVRGRVAEKLIGWHRAGRVSDTRALELAEKPGRFILQLPLGILPAGLYRFLTDGQFAKEKLAYIFVRPVKLYFNAELREQWLREMVAQGQGNHIITDEDAADILGQLKEPFIQKYLQSLAVHICTLPVTQVVSVIVACWYKVANQLTWGEAWEEMLLILLAFQATPISPGSICRGLYVVYLVVREKNFKDYNIAVFLGFFKYVGYLAFPIQMANRYPVLARFMAAHWATGAVHVVPVFGERGALLEHAVYSVFYNWPLTIRRRMEIRAGVRERLAGRWWHVLLCAAGGVMLFVMADDVFACCGRGLPGWKDIWWLTLGVPLVAGALVTLGAGGMKLGRRIALAAVGGVMMGLVYAVYHGVVGETVGATEWAKLILWGVFLMSIFAAVGAILTELKLPELAEPGEESLKPEG